MTSCTLAKAIIGFTREASMLPLRELPPIEPCPCLCEPPCPRPSERQIIVFLRDYPNYVEIIDSAFPECA